MFVPGSIIITFELHAVGYNLLKCDIEHSTWLLKQLVETGDLAEHISDLQGNTMILDLSSFVFDEQIYVPAGKNNRINVQSHTVLHITK